jgi:hypothetical protein
MAGACRGSLVALGVALAVASVGCGDNSFTVQRSVAFPSSGAALSVFGVFKDGRMSPEAWDDLRPRLTPILGAAACQTAYPEALNASGPELTQAIDDYTRANGVTEDLLDLTGPMAKGDLVLLVIMTGRPHVAKDAPSEPSQPPPPARPGGRGGRGYQSVGPGRTPGREPDAFEVAASLFSVKTHRLVGAISLRYTGQSRDEALQSFAERLTAELPQATCAGWSADVHVEPTKVRKLESE